MSAPLEPPSLESARHQSARQESAPANADALALSIDLVAEIRNITQKQHLNDVHYTVQLIRHALRHRAPAVHLTSGSRAFVIEHEGQPLDPEERDLLFELLGPGATESRQAAMTELERRHGVTLLSLLLTHDEVHIESDTSFIAVGGRLRRSSVRRARGYRITVRRTRRSSKEERREIEFYCRCCDVPVSLNGRALPREPIGVRDAEDSLLRLELRAAEGVGTVGFPRRGMMSRTRYYKHGVYFGVRQHAPSDHLPIEGAFNARDDAFEENFRASVKNAGSALSAGRAALLEYVPQQIGALPRAERARVRGLLLGMAERRWSDPLRAMPLFDTGAAPLSRSLQDLEEDGLRRGFLPWLPRGEAPRRGPRSTLVVLDEGDLAPLARLIAVPLRRALPSAARTSGLAESPSTSLPLLPDDACPPSVRALLQALRSVSADPTWVVTTGGTRSVKEDRGTRVVHLPLGEPLLARCARAYAERPQRLDLIRAALMG